MPNASTIACPIKIKIDSASADKSAEKSAEKIEEKIVRQIPVVFHDFTGTRSVN